MSEEKENVYKINDIEYFYNILLVNNTGERSVLLTQDAVKLLVIEDSIEDPFASGYIVIDNDNNALQRKYKKDDEEIDELFDFNFGDKDYIYIEIVPKMYSEQKKNDINASVWNLKYIFTIYDIEDYDTEDVMKNYKKLYFMDFQKYEFFNKTSNFSTASLEKEIDIPPYLRDDGDRVEKTGNCIKEIIKQTIDNPDFDNENWDKGSNEIFYTSPADNTYLDDLMNIYRIHQSNESGDWCILSKTRYTEKWVLESMGDIVSKSLNQTDKTKSGEYLMEAFIIADTAEMPVIPKKTRVPTDFGVSRNTSFGDLSKLENFKMFEVSKQDKSEEMGTKISYSYDFDNGKFKIEHYDVSESGKFYNENYVNKLKSKKSLFKPTDNQLKNKKIEYGYASSYTPENTFEFLTRNDVLKSQCILGLGIEFSLTGMTNRQSGRFFSIRKNHNYYDNFYESKLQGIWFCTSVTHIFSGSSYTNDVVGVKLNLS